MSEAEAACKRFRQARRVADLVSSKAERLQKAAEANLEKRGRPKMVRFGIEQWREKVEEEKVEEKEEDKDEEAVKEGLKQEKLLSKLKRKRSGDHKPRVRKDTTRQQREETRAFLDSKLSDLDEKQPWLWWNERAKETKMPVKVMRQLCGEKIRSQDAASKAESRKGRKRYWRRNESSTTGMRKKRKFTEDASCQEGGLLRPQKMLVKKWAEEEMAENQGLCGNDLLYQFELELEDFIWLLQARAKSEGEERNLTDMEQRKLQAALSSLKSCADRTQKGSVKQSLLKFCEVVERRPNLVFPMTLEESKLVCSLTWASFDRLMHVLLYGSDEDLAAFSALPADEYRAQVEDMPIVNTDAVPVYLDCSTGKVLMHTSVLRLAQLRRLAKKSGAEPGEVPDQLHLTAEGESRQDKDRLTWLVRLMARNGFKKPTLTEQGDEVPAPRSIP